MAGTEPQESHYQRLNQRPPAKAAHNVTRLADLRERKGKWRIAAKPDINYVELQRQHGRKYGDAKGRYRQTGDRWGGYDRKGGRKDT